ncbi:major capsid protein [Mitsuokella sp.]|uniref:major capsid protein n=1 Tax=Mitsuokella sp. TaxID=2049034 RepID=UPI003D7E45C4
MPIALNDTLSLITAVERIQTPASLLVDIFFPQVPAVSPSANIAVEYRKHGRRLAPYVVQGAHGVSVAREGSTMRLYQPPVVAPRRILTAEDVRQRSFGENIQPGRHAEERANQLMAQDLVDLSAMIMNRKNQVAASILTTGGYTIEGYADDGKTVRADTISFDWDKKITLAKTWDLAGATIYSDLKNASEKIQEDAGMIPTVAIVGKNIAEYLINNDEISKWLMVPNAANLSMMSFQPRYTQPQIMRIGIIQSLNLEIYQYNETYLDDAGKVQSFIGENDVVIGIPGRGRQLHGSIDLVQDDGTFKSYDSEMVPQYSADKGNNQTSMTMYSRFILAPETSDDWAYIKAK